MSRRQTVILVILLAMAAALSAAALLIPSPEPELRSATLLDNPRSISEFELIDQHEQAFGRANLEGSWNLVFIGFTHCPDACPTTLSLLGELDSRIRTDGHDLQSVFVSVDPERDTPEVLDRYVSFFSGEIVAATGPKKQLDRFCDDLGFAYLKVPGRGEEYSIDHSGALALIDDQARVAGYFTPPFELDELVTDIVRILNSH